MKRITKRIYWAPYYYDFAYAGKPDRISGMGDFFFPLFWRFFFKVEQHEVCDCR